MCTLAHCFWVKDVRENFGRAGYELRRVRDERIIYRVDVLLAYRTQFGQVVPNICAMFAKSCF
jgi:hypothetical protein